MTIEKYIALNNPREVAAILEAHGSRKINKDNIIDVIHRFTEKKGDFAFQELAKIDTPYKRLILSTIEEKKSGCAGCGGTCGEKKSNCCGSGVDGEKVLLTTEKEVGPPIKETIIIEKQVPALPEKQGFLTQHGLMVAGVVLLGVLTIAVVLKK